jgi:diguanylate cyclase (GGDEF)-like protein
VLTRRAGTILSTAFAALGVFACWIAFEWGGQAVTDTVSDAASPAFAILAFACAVTVALRASDRLRLAWGIFSFGLFGWLVGDLFWLVSRLGGSAGPSGFSFADVAYLTLPIATGVAWSVNAPRERRPLALRPLLDGLIVSSSLFLVLWVVLLDRLFAQNAENDGALALALAYPVADLIMVTMALVVTAAVPAPYRGSMVIVTAGLIVIAITDSALVYVQSLGERTAPVLAIGWAAGMVLIAAGALNELRSPHLANAAVLTVPRRQLFWLPYAPMPLAIAAGVVTLWEGTDDPKPVLAAGVIAVTATLIRQLTVLLENRALLEAVATQALRDPLTGLANRLLFSDRLDHAMLLRRRDDRTVSVLSLDLDDFKMVNDNLGHAYGDTLLRHIADRINSVVPAGDTVARLGGDEFAVLIEDGPLAAEDLAQRVVEVFDKPFFIDGEDLYIHPSVGLATTPALRDGEITADELFKHADLAMYTAKRAGVGGVQAYSSDMTLVDRAELRTSMSDSGIRRRTPMAGIQLLGQLRRAIEDDELVLVYQPKIDLATGGIVGVEALIRWPHPELGLLTPNQFLPLVRQNGLMGAVTDLVLDRAVADAVTWYEAGACDLPVAINLFAPSLNDLALPDRILGALNDVGLPPTALSVEITEHLLVANIRRASTVIERLRANGLRTAIDDFGSGYATMSYLRDLPIDELKLDRQFIAPVLRSERAAAIVRSVIDLAHTLGIACVAEGVEDKGTADRLRDYGCDIAQGHYFSPPMSADMLAERCQPGCSSSAIFPITN